jgi:hypothetical protein
VLLQAVPSGSSSVSGVGGCCRVGRCGAVAAAGVADPPYPGKAYLYRGHPDYAGEVDHAALIVRLAAYDGWALSTSAEALPMVLGLCPPGVRVAAWHRGERAGRSRYPLHGWEPVIYRGGRQLPGERRVDSIVCGPGPLTTAPVRVVGAKPAVVCRWIFGLLGALPGDVLDDLFPGSGAVSRAWAAYSGPPRLEPGEVSSPAVRYASYLSREALCDGSRVLVVLVVVVFPGQ